MASICLIFLVHESFDCLTYFECAFREVDPCLEVIKVPFEWRFDRAYVKTLKKLIREKSKSRFVVFSPQSTEMFLKEADLTLLFSAYSRWFDPKTMHVIPHLWTPAKTQTAVAELIWKKKPPLRVGFMGRAYEDSRQISLISRFPRFFKHWLLKGTFLKHPELVAILNGSLGFAVKTINAFPRLEVLQSLIDRKIKHPSMELELVRTGFYGTEDEISAYVRHLQRSTYVLCPRGTENYSYRMYEALSHGRVPVIIDTDMVLPKEIDWERLAIRVPYASIDRIYEYLLEDYESHSAEKFLARQQAAIETMQELQSMRWIKKLANETLALAKKKLQN